MTEVKVHHGYVELIPDKPVKRVLVYTRWGVKAANVDDAGNFNITMDER